MLASLLTCWFCISAVSVAQGLTSTSGSCAATSPTNETCLGSRWGDCCSAHGFCGNNDTYCGTGCQAGFGSCYANANLISVDASCGVNGTTCLGSSFGNCCSPTGFCGSTSSYCDTGCQSAFGACGASAANATIPLTTASAALPSSSATVISSSLSSTIPTSSTGSASTTKSTTANAATSTSASTDSEPQSKSQSATSSTGFKAGMAIAAVAVAAIIGALVWFFAIRNRRQSRTSAGMSNEKYNAYDQKPELDSKATFTSMSTSEMGGYPIVELPAPYQYSSMAGYGKGGAMVREGEFRGPSEIDGRGR